MAQRPAKPTKGGRGVPASPKVEKHDIPDPVAWLQANVGGADGTQNAGSQFPSQGFGNPMAPGQAGRTMPTTSSGKAQGQQTPGATSKKEQQGQKTPAAQARGTGKKQTQLSPNNKKRAGTMTKGKPAFGLPSRNAIARRITPVGSSSAPSAANASGRTGLMSRFEGFTPNKG